jgi:hypothetical protein
MAQAGTGRGAEPGPGVLFASAPLDQSGRGRNVDCQASTEPPGSGGHPCWDSVGSYTAARPAVPHALLAQDRGADRAATSRDAGRAGRRAGQTALVLHLQNVAIRPLPCQGCASCCVRRNRHCPLDTYPSSPLPPLNLLAAPSVMTSMLLAVTWADDACEIEMELLPSEVSPFT